MLDERTEQLINRKVDGELGEGELLELQKRLIRSPEARALLEEYEAMEALASEALHGLRAGERLQTQAAAQHAADAVVHAGRWGWLRPAMAAAAMIAFVVLGSRPFAGRQADPGLGLPGATRPLAMISGPAGDSLTSTWDVPRRQAERIDGNVVGIYDENTRSYYFIELDQRDTTITPVSMNY